MDYESPLEYFANKVDAIKALGTEKHYDPDFHYIIEIEVK
jgi:hypothetical protein